jgi:hypothetical protein
MRFDVAIVEYAFPTDCNPTVGSTSCNFSMAAAGTVLAIGMWGQGANANSYPAGYCFVPSGGLY